MDSSTHKRYHEDGFDSRQHLESYLSDNPDMISVEDSLIFPIKNLMKSFTEACDFFKHIIVLKMRDRCIMEMKRWVDSRTGAFDWNHATQLHADIEGNSDQLQDKEGKVRSALQHIVKCDLEKENIMDPIVLPPADCIISFGLLDMICKDKDDYIRYLRKLLKLLKPGGHIILIGGLEMTFYTVGKQKFHALNYDEDFARKALVGEGLIIDRCEVKKRTVMNDHNDYKAMIFIAAHKEM
ncbi:nicotinamide N-methyltransferase-like isoform X2 [Ranitomeya variabilis]|uniref:nicotinamide N-methyltransferase-like isoform X2 n=1 Tax=Ranitomeya variabilis TaxID=490064 RepID=UPI0040562E3C